MLPSLKKSDRCIGVIFEHSHVTAVELEHGAKGFMLTAAGSFEAQTNFENRAALSERGERQRQKAFASELGSFLKKIGAASKRLSFGLNTSMLMLQTVPMEAALDHRRQQEQALWELKNFDTDASDTSHVLITQQLAGASETQTGSVPTVVVGVRRSFVQFLTNTASLLSASFNILDVQHFCAENAFNANYANARAQRTLLIGMDDHSLTASTLADGQSLDVQVRSFSGDDTRMIFDFVRQSGAEQIFLHGSGASYQLCESIRRSLDVPVALVDPFRTVMVPASVKGLADIKARRHEFTAAVGLAMRTE
jgi:Tfp pilus assembly PilM family ATPase